jgi:Domain of unknown function (DUF397)
MQIPGTSNQRQQDAQALWRRAGACATSECVEVAALAGEVAMRSSRRPDVHLTFTKTEWSEFLRGAKAGDFDDLFAGE